MTPEYRVNLYLNGRLIGDCREQARDLTWVRRRTRAGVDEIDFTINDKLFSNWCKKYGVTFQEMLKPYALECRLVRNGEEIIGGFLATMPSYSPHGTSADLALRFDGWLNLLAGVYIYPETGKVTGRMGALIERFITLANTRSSNAGKSFGFTKGSIETLPIIEHTFDNFKPVKEWFTDRCDNVTGAGEFDIYFHADKTYDVAVSNHFGDVISDYAIRYPMEPNSPSAVSISASESSGFASKVIALGGGETSSEENDNTAITSEASNNALAVEYGYCEVLYQNSSISVQETLDGRAQTELAIASNITWNPQISLTGTQVEPKPSGDLKIWVGDTVTIRNDEDLTGYTNGQFRVNELAVKVLATGAEEITPTLERVNP